MQDHGRLYLPKDQTLHTAAALPLTAGLREKFQYNNWNYGLAALVTQPLAGLSLGSYLAQRFFEPLGMTRTSVIRPQEGGDDVSEGYMALANATPARIDRPFVGDDQIMFGAMGVNSCVKDLLTFYGEMLRSGADQLANGSTSTEGSPFKCVPDIWNCQAPLPESHLRERYYGLGLFRTQLPNTMMSTSMNGGRLPSPPVVARGSRSQLALYHGGNSAASQNWAILLPETQTAIVVLTNTMANCDAANLIASMLLEALLDSPEKHDYEELARVASKAGVEQWQTLHRSLSRQRIDGTSPKPLESYAGKYWNHVGNWHMDIYLEDGGLVMAFQGDRKNSHALRHYNYDVFTWLLSQDENVAIGRFPYTSQGQWLLNFQSEDGAIKGLKWNQNGIKDGEYFHKGEYGDFPNQKPDLTGRLQALDPIIKAICSATGAPGLSLGVARGGSIFHTAHYGYRDVEKALPPDSDTAYGVASLTKSFVASAMGIVVDEGRLSWTTPVKNILPELNSQDPLVTEQLTITDLFIHNTGLASSNHWWYGADGELLLRKDQTLAAFKALKQKGKFRAQYSYSNWPYCVAGEVIEKVSGQSFGTFLQQRILGPLHLSRTSAAHDNNSDQNLAKPYAVLDNGEAFLLPFPKTGDGQIMAPAQAVRSSVNDMLKYGSALLEAQKAELAAGQTLPESNPLRGAATQLSAHITKTAQSPEFLLERTYGFGMERFQLPQAVDGVGCNSMFVKQMPKLVPGPNSKGGLLLVHTGSIAGYSSMLALLPEHDIVAFAVANSVGLGDPSGWVVQALVETISESENTTDFVSLAKEAAANHARREVDNMKVLEDHRTPDTQPRPLDEYVGTYVGLAGLFGILIRRRRRSAGEEGLEVLFQGLESQAWPLTHYHFDTFTWIQPFNEQARRARFNLVGPDLFKIRFMAGEEEEEGNGKTGETVIDRVCWMQEPGLLEKDQCFLREKKELRRQL